MNHAISHRSMPGSCSGMCGWRGARIEVCGGTRGACIMYRSRLYHTGVCETNISFVRALTMQSSSQNFHPPPELVLPISCYRAACVSHKVRWSRLCCIFAFRATAISDQIARALVNAYDMAVNSLFVTTASTETPNGTILGVTCFLFLPSVSQKLHPKSYCWANIKFTL